MAFWLTILVPLSVAAAPYAALVMDARNGKVLHAENADTRLHPASLTKMMTLYIVFEAVQNGEISMDSVVKVSKAAASEPPSRLGLRAGQRIKLRYLVRAAAVKSANDASTAIAEAISGSEAAFARRMNRTAKAIGMTRTTFKNAHGLTESGHLSTARDMSILGRHMIYDYPQYYNLFSRMTADAGVRNVAHTNQRLLSSYRGADGIKTGYTKAAGFNLVASAERGRERVIATVFGGRSTTTRNRRVAELLDLGFRRAKTRVALTKPPRPPYMGKSGPTLVATLNSAEPAPGKRAKTIRAVSAAVSRSLRPVARPIPVEADPLVAEAIEDKLKLLLDAPEDTGVEAEAAPVIASLAPKTSPKPAMRPENLTVASASAPVRPAATEVITRISTSGGRHWGVHVGRFTTRVEAQKALLKVALLEMETLDGSLRKVVSRPVGHDAHFMGLTRDIAERACARLQARHMSCFMVGPG